ncbi:hypothetical protein SDC9_200143 [bioreactor metagenome]|uniref:Uncharacterized protein n=1 Tax=bioreactor metagenome TaxID=1076179 RepID=A0A645IMF2_9ZZZZ
MVCHRRFYLQHAVFVDPRVDLGDLPFHPYSRQGERRNRYPVAVPDQAQFVLQHGEGDLEGTRVDDMAEHLGG